MTVCPAGNPKPSDVTTNECPSPGFEKDKEQRQMSSNKNISTFKTIFRTSAVLAAFTVFSVVAASVGGLISAAISGTPDSTRGITPLQVTSAGPETEFPASVDADTCSALAAFNLPGWEGLDLSQAVGQKIDPPVPGNFTGIITMINQPFLSWESTSGFKVLAVVMKGGNDANIYNYANTDFTFDSGLASPPAGSGNPADVSHYNFCYIPVEEDEDGEGCTPGYWKNHTDRWIGYLPTADFDATFGVNVYDPNITLKKALEAKGGGINALARHATAALLNARASELPEDDPSHVDYSYTVAEVLSMVQAAIAGGSATIESTKNQLEEANELGCPLGGTSATN